MCVRLQAGLAQRLLQELGHLEADAEQLALLLLLPANQEGRNGDTSMWAHRCELVLKCRRERVREDLEHYRDEQLHEWDDHEDSERDEPKQILRRPLEL